MVRWCYKILRSVLVTALLLAAVVPTVLFVGLSLPPVQNHLRDVAENELTTLLGTPVRIGRVMISPFSSVTLGDVSVTDSVGNEMLTVKRLGAGIDAIRLLTGDIRVTYAELFGLDARLNRPSAGAPLNIQPVIDRLKPKDKNKPPTRFDLAINTVVIRKSELHYDILDSPATPGGRFSPDHIAVYDLKADVTLPRVSNDMIVIDLKRLAFAAENAITVSSLSGRAEISPTLVSVKDLDIAMPASHLILSQVDIPLKTPWREMPLAISLLPGCKITPADFSAFIPQLSSLSDPLSIALDAEGTPSDFVIHSVSASLPGDALSVNAEAQLSGLPDGLPHASVKLQRLEAKANAATILDITKCFASLKPNVEQIIGRLGAVSVEARGAATDEIAELRCKLSTAAGSIETDAKMTRAGHRRTFGGHLFTEGIDLAMLLPGLGSVAPLGLDADVAFSPGSATERSGMFDGQISNLTWKGYTYADIAANVTLNGQLVEGGISIDDPNISITADGHGAIPPGDGNLALTADITHFNPSALGLTDRYPGYDLSSHIDIALSGNDPDDITGHIGVTDLIFAHCDNESSPALRLDRIDISSTLDSIGRQISIDSDVINGDISGRFRFATLASTVKGIAARINPELFPEVTSDAPLPDNSLRLRLTIEPDNPLTRFVTLPVGIIAPVTLSGEIDSDNGMMSADISAPYLQQKNKLIEGTSLTFSAKAPQRIAELHATSVFPTKAGPMSLFIDSNGINGRHDTRIEWAVAERPNYGDLRFTTSFSRDTTLTTRIDVNPGRIVFNDTVWTVAPSLISVADNRVVVDRFRVSHSDQLLSIDGSASADTTSTLLLRLRDINLDYVFETLNIPNVMFGGDATGTFHASRLFSRTPEAYTDDLFVRGLSYNRCVMGDGHIRSAWHPETGDISINAVIDEAEGRKSYIDGSIHPTKELLDFHFRADKAPVGFLQPFMAAFCNRITGYASGEAHLFGTFKLLDMTGDIFAQDLAMDIGFTNTTYHATDSVHITPGRIELNNIVITDDQGKSARLSGLLTHKDFKEPRFTFRVTDARDFLAYDIRPNNEHPWYGKVYGTGSVTISGEPGIVNIGVDMATGAGTDFSFVLSDEEVAADYSFITFRDKTPREAADIEVTDSLQAEPLLVRMLRQRVKQSSQDSPTAYAMTFNIDVTPQARVTLVMDPAGGDKIRATGSGNLRMSYDSANEELKMYGTYTLQRGSYNFTLQDIIIKDFTIEDGSSIAFHGDPYSAMLDIHAYYALNANLSDLDESFLQDRELNRTNVPVHAVMNVSGDMRSPEISFDLEFPTLTQDTYRKVRSIVSTDEMMNRQIIYLLALNRFYTPDYMDATRGNELVSVASSTISSQLSNMLGQLSDKFSIAPSIRSDRGDFSDVEFDVALSSHLLNNRLLLNGNLGYRDKSLNNNSFIGDFDIEYLLNRSGSIRLKAYNRYNDQNYYLKSALTTQGVGVMFKRDFDYLFDFVRRLRRKYGKKHPSPAESVTATPADTMSTTPTSPDNGQLPSD